MNAILSRDELMREPLEDARDLLAKIAAGGEWTEAEIVEVGRNLLRGDPCTEAAVGAMALLAGVEDGEEADASEVRSVLECLERAIAFLDGDDDALVPTAGPLGAAPTRDGWYWAQRIHPDGPDSRIGAPEVVFVYFAGTDEERVGAVCRAGQPRGDHRGRLDDFVWRGALTAPPAGSGDGVPVPGVYG